MDLNDKIKLLREQDAINKMESKHDNLPKLSLKRLSELLSVNKMSLYYKEKKVSVIELTAKHLIDELHTNHPNWEYRRD